MPTKTCLVGKHIVTLFYPISTVVENSSNTFSMYLKISGGSISIGEAQIRATISGQELAAGIGDWNGRISVNENISLVPISDIPFGADIFEDTMTLILPEQAKPNFVQTFGNIPITEQTMTIDTFTDRTWFSEILCSFVLSAVRGRPWYNGYVTLNNSDAFILRKRYTADSSPRSLDSGFAEKLRLDLDYLESVETVVVSSHTADRRNQRTVNTADTSVIVPEEVETANGKFELKAIIQTEQTSVAVEIDEGYLENMTADTSEFYGVKGVEFGI